MRMFKSLYHFFKNWNVLFKKFVYSFFVNNTLIRLENLALQSQLMEQMEKQRNYKLPKKQQNTVFKQLWVILSRILPNWKELLFKVQPATVVRWHRTAFKIYWKRKSKKIGRPKLKEKTIELILKIYNENQHLSPEKIRESLILKGVTDAPAPNTIAKYIKQHSNHPKRPTAKQKQSWRTFLKNHADYTWAADFFTIPTFTMKILHVLVIIHHKSRKIVYFNVTTNPNAEWVVQQFRNATPYGKAPKYLIHDNDPLFRAKRFQRFL